MGLPISIGYVASAKMVNVMGIVSTPSATGSPSITPAHSTIRFFANLSRPPTRVSCKPNRYIIFSDIKFGIAPVSSTIGISTPRMMPVILRCLRGRFGGSSYIPVASMRRGALRVRRLRILGFASSASPLASWPNVRPQGVFANAATTS